MTEPEDLYRLGRRYGLTRDQARANVARTIQRQLRRSAVPDGLCAQRGDHPDHEHTSESLGRFWCTGRKADREPGRSERARS